MTGLEVVVVRGFFLGCMIQVLLFMGVCMEGVGSKSYSRCASSLSKVFRMAIPFTWISLLQSKRLPESVQITGQHHLLRQQQGQSSAVLLPPSVSRQTSRPENSHEALSMASWDLSR